MIQELQVPDAFGPVRSRGRHAYAIFDDGRVASFVAGEERDRPTLAELLLKKRVLGEKELGRALKRSGRRPLSKVLADSGDAEHESQLAAVRRRCLMAA